MRSLSPFVIVVVLSGCGGPAVLGSDELPVRRVVLYRNGVAYFERQGEFTGNELTFAVRQSEVGDFLSSLTAVDRTAGGEVRSVSFEVPEPPEPPTVPSPPMPMAQCGMPFVPPAPPPAPAESPEGPRVDVRLRLQGDDHNMTAAYVIGAPIWRPSYRAVVDEQGALLQAWAVVQNVSGEDWSGVQLSLTTGAPIAFRSDLGNPVTPERPTVTDTGEVVMSVPEAETTLAQRGPAPAPPPRSAPGAAPMGGASGELEYDEQQSEGAEERSAGRSRRRVQTRSSVSRGVSAGDVESPDASFAQGITAQELQNSVTSMASIAVLSEGATRYDIRGPVTVPDGGSTMVAILSQRVPGQEAFLFAPDGGVPLSVQHPFRVMRLENHTGAMLERGPISVLGRGSFLGQGVLQPLPRDATAFVPFALDRSVVVESSHAGGEAPGRLIRVTRDQVVVERFTSLTTTYTIRNGGADAAKVYVRHNRMGGATLVSPPTGTELTPTSALVPSTVAARGQAELRLEERTPVQRQVQFMTSAAADAVQLYLEGPAIDAAQGPALRRALELRAQLVTLQERIAAASTQRETLAQNAEETRANLLAVRRIERAADLRARLVQRLTDLESQLSTLTRDLVAAQTSASEVEVRLNEALQDVTLVVPSVNP